MVLCFKVVRLCKGGIVHVETAVLTIILVPFVLEIVDFIIHRRSGKVELQGKLMVSPDSSNKSMHQVHDHPTAGHPGRDKTIRKAREIRDWPGMTRNSWIEQYVKGCAVCQQNKIFTHRKKTPYFFRSLIRVSKQPLFLSSAPPNLLLYHECHASDCPPCSHTRTPHAGARPP